MSTPDLLSITIAVNGSSHTLAVAPSLTLAELLRARLGLTGTKIGCAVGECGACTVLLDGRPALSCLLLAAELDGAQVVTIEGLAADEPTPLQRAFWDEAAVQCGYCTPGMILAASAIPKGSCDAEIRAALSGNLCRCTGYTKIVAAVRRAHAGEGS